MDRLGRHVRYRRHHDRSALDALALEASNSVGLYSQSRNFNAGMASGNVWMISAALVNSDPYYDGFKLKKLNYEIATVAPEPSTWAMLILGMGMVGGAMRRRTRVRHAFV